MIDRRQHRITQYQALAYTPNFTAAELITVDKWYRALSEPRELRKDRVADFAAFTFGFPFVIGMDSWWRDLSTPPKKKPRTAEYPFFAYGTPPLVAGPDRWWKDFDTPPKKKPRTANYPFLAFTPIVPETGGEIAWYVPFTQPKRDKFGLPTQYQIAEIRTPIVVYGPRAMGYIIV